MSKNELVEYSKLPNLQTAQSQLCAVLDSASSCFVSQLQQSQQNLISHLNNHMEQKNKETPQENENN